MPITSDELIDELSRAYFKLLTSLDWADRSVVAGLREGLNKFLSNLHLALVPGPSKWHKSQMVSSEALQKLGSGDLKGLCFEHVVPKAKHLQRPCEEAARSGALTEAFVKDLIARYWIVATITREEDGRLARFRMPAGWDEVDILARYDAAGIALVPNPYLGKG